MGKKTNWANSEDLTLCRAWLNAGDGIQLQGGQHKAATFWRVVQQLFHAELDTSVERPLAGLKIRWSRINRDVQKFAVVYAQVQSVAATDVKEEDCVEEAKAQFMKQHGCKFAFEDCWKLVRFSPRWLLCKANAAGLAVSSASVRSTSIANPSTSISTNTFLNAEVMTPVTTAAVSAPQALLNGLSVPSSSMSASTAVSAGMGGNANALSPPINSGNKRRATQQPTPEYNSRSHAGSDLPSSTRAAADQFGSIASALVGEVRRHNDLLEEQNAISLLRTDPDMIADDEARECFHLLRRCYFKRIRASAEAGEEDDASGMHATQESRPSAGSNNAGVSGKSVIQTNVV